MTQADAVTVRVNPRKAIVQGALYGVLALLFGAPTTVAMFAGGAFEAPVVLGLVLSVLFGAIAASHVGLALRTPVALRMDSKGISGWYTPPATWDEIEKITMLAGPKDAKLLAFGLHDPIAFRDRQSPWQRLTSWSNGRNNGHHIVIPQALLLGTQVEDLLPGARAFHAQATSAGDGP